MNISILKSTLRAICCSLAAGGCMTIPDNRPLPPAYEEITLSRKHPTNASVGITLRAINSSGLVTVLLDGNVTKAHVGENFSINARMSPFHVMKVDPKTGIAVIRVRNTVFIE